MKASCQVQFLSVPAGVQGVLQQGLQGALEAASQVGAGGRAASRWLLADGKEAGGGQE